MHVLSLVPCLLGNFFLWNLIYGPGEHDCLSLVRFYWTFNISEDACHRHLLVHILLVNIPFEILYDGPQVSNISYDQTAMVLISS